MASLFHVFGRLKAIPGGGRTGVEQGTPGVPRMVAQEGWRRGLVGGGGGGVGEGRTFRILYISTPDQPPHGGITGRVPYCCKVVKIVVKNEY